MEGEKANELIKEEIMYKAQAVTASVLKVKLLGFALTFFAVIYQATVGE